MKLNQIIRLRDGRALCFNRLGAVGGRAIFYFHGWPGSRLEAAVLEDPAKSLGVEVVAVDRPGYGLSDFLPQRLILDWPRDIGELAAFLGLKTFSVVGVSGGGPYAAACAHAMPERLDAVGIVCGLGPPDVPGATRGMAYLNRALFFLARKMPWLGGLLFDNLAGILGRNPSLIVSPRMTAGLPEIDRETLRNPIARDALTGSMAEAFRQGPAGARHDGLLYARPWGFPLEAIEIEVKLWHGELDVNVPVSMGRAVAQRIPRCRAQFHPHDGHISLPFNHAAEILRELGTAVPPGRGVPTPP